MGAAACKALAPDLDAVVAIEVIVPDSGRVEVGDTLHPRARALNGRGDSTAATFEWSSLDTTLEVVDATGAAVGRFPGTGRLVVHSGTLRSNPVVITVLAALDSIAAAGPTRSTVVVSTPDSLSDSLQVHAFGPVNTTVNANVPVALSIDFPPGGAGLTLVPGDTVRTNSAGIAVFQVRLTGARPDSAVVTASARHANGTPVAGSPVTFVVEFLP